MTQIKKIYWADKLGAISALFCIVHCLAVPTLLAMELRFLKNPIIAFLFILIAFISISKTTRAHHVKGANILLWIAFTGFVVSIVLEEQAGFFEYATYFFSTLLILGHLYNIRQHSNL